MTAGTDQKLIACWIGPERRSPGDPDARIVDTGIPVWAFVGHHKGNGEDGAITAEDYRLPRKAVEAALAY
jgi:uncharacterized protein (DUF433 family)